MTPYSYRSLAVALLGLAACTMSLSGCVVAPAPYYADEPGEPPPLPRNEIIGVAPGPDYVWIAGFWNWGGRQYDWTPGHWEHRREGYHWAPHHWEHEGDHWHAHGGRWENDR